jgi:hypothetical protein
MKNGMGQGRFGEIDEAWRSGLAMADAKGLNLCGVKPSSNGFQKVPSPARAERVVKLTPASIISPKIVEWLWRFRVPFGMLTLFAGDPKLGKSFCTLDIAAAVSRGAALPGGDIPDGPGAAVILSAEDDPARTIVPRLRAAGANLSNVHILESIILPGDPHAKDGPRPPLEMLPSLQADLALIERAVTGLGNCRLIIVDPITAYVGAVDDHRNAELRGLLSPLKSLAERLNVAVILVSHLNKAGGINGKHRVQGSVAYVAACRANFLFLRDKDDPTGQRVLLLDNGCNLAPAAPGLAFCVKDRGDGPVVEWFASPVDKNADTALRELAEAQASIERPEQAASRKDCEAFLRECLGNGPTDVRDVEKFATNSGFSRATLYRAKLSLGVTSARSWSEGKVSSTWALPTT